jgi:hypothetical protein
MKCNSIAKSSLVVLSLLLSVAGVHAQSVQAKVPFAFKVGSTQLPAGTYAINNEIGTNFVTVRNVQTGSSVMALGRQESPSKKTNKLIFHRYGSQYSLTAILGSQGSQGMSLPAPKQQKQLEEASVSAIGSDTVEIAGN